MHPICPVVTDDGLYGFIIPSPKLNDLKRDGRYALHSYPLPENEDVFYVTGHAKMHDDGSLRRTVAEAFVAQPGRIGPPLPLSHFGGQTLVEFLIDCCLVTRTTGHGDPNAQHTIWKA